MGRHSSGDSDLHVLARSGYLRDDDVTLVGEGWAQVFYSWEANNWEVDDDGQYKADLSIGVTEQLVTLRCSREALLAKNMVRPFSDPSPGAAYYPDFLGTGSMWDGRGCQKWRRNNV